MENADTQPAPTGSQAPAARDELLIPKHRLDQAMEETRRLREEIAMKDRLYMQDKQQMLAQRQPQQQDPTPEETGLDPQTHAAVVKLANRIADTKIAKKSQEYENYFGNLATRTERTELLATHGADKQKYLPEIQRRQVEYNQTTGGFMPAELALKLILADEKDARIAALEARLAGNPAPAAPAQSPAAAAQPAPTPVAVPSAAGTRQIPQGGAPAPAAAPAGGGFSSLSLEEMEARLDERLRSGEAAI